MSPRFDLILLCPPALTSTDERRQRDIGIEQRVVPPGRAQGDFHTHLEIDPGVRLHDLLTGELGAGTRDDIGNDTGGAVTSAAVGVPSYRVSFP